MGLVPQLNLNPLIFTSADYLIALSVKGIPYPLLLVQEFELGARKNAEYQYQIGSTEPTEIITTSSTYPGRLQIEAGYLEPILAVNLYASATQIRDATISVISTAGVLLKLYDGVAITSSSASVKAGDKRSIVNLTFEALSITGT